MHEFPSFAVRGKFSVGKLCYLGPLFRIVRMFRRHHQQGEADHRPVEAAKTHGNNLTS